MNFYLRIITGRAEDQYHHVPLAEAHKAYYLFFRPNTRGVFKDGFALAGSQILEIIPDYKYSCAYHEKQIKFITEVLARARVIAGNASPEDLAVPLNELLKGKYKTQQLITTPESI